MSVSNDRCSYDFHSATYLEAQGIGSGKTIRPRTSEEAASTSALCNPASDGKRCESVAVVVYTLQILSAPIQARIVPSTFASALEQSGCGFIVVHNLRKTAFDPGSRSLVKPARLDDSEVSGHACRTRFSRLPR